MEKKTKSVDEKLTEYRKGIISGIGRWEDINQNGCNDPFWQDGHNMNLTRNHILYYKEMISTTCQENGISFPEEYYLQTPPEVANSYMANLNKKAVSRE